MAGMMDISSPSEARVETPSFSRISSPLMQTIRNLFNFLSGVKSRFSMSGNWQHKSNSASATVTPFTLTTSTPIKDFKTDGNLTEIVMLHHLLPLLSQIFYFHHEPSFHGRKNTLRYCKVSFMLNYLS